MPHGLPNMQVPEACATGKSGQWGGGETFLRHRENHRIWQKEWGQKAKAEGFNQAREGGGKKASFRYGKGKRHVYA